MTPLSTPRNSHALLAALAALVTTLVVFASTARADVVRTGDVSPSFTVGPIVDLTGQRVFIGSTVGGVGTQGTLSITPPGTLTAAQIVAGFGGSGVGTVSVSGAGSVINLTGGATNNGLDIGSWGTGTVTVSNGGLIACSSAASCLVNDIGNGAGSTGLLSISGGTVSGLGNLAVGRGNLLTNFGTPGANTSGTLSITNGGMLSSSGFSSVASNNGQTGIVSGSLTISGAGSSWNISRDLAAGVDQAFLGIARASNTNANVTISNGGNLTITGSRSDPTTDNSLPGFNMSAAGGATSVMTVTSGGSVRIGGDTGVITVGGNSSIASAGANATLNITGGGTVSGTGPNGLNFMAVGQNLGTGTVNISGTGSQLVVAGVGGQNTQGLDGIGGLVMVGRNRNNGGGGNGNLNVSGGGSLVISDNGQIASPFSMGLRIATAADSIGNVTVSGAGSSIAITSAGGAEASPHVLVGNGGIGQMTISNGASVSVQSSGQRNFIVGNAGTGSGSLNVTNGGVINASRFAVADVAGAVGVATINSSTINLDGAIFLNGFNGTPFGAGVRVGRGDGTSGILNLQNGATININNTFDSAAVLLGGSATLTAGSGTVNMSTGSRINFTGSAANASLQVGSTTNGTGIMTMTGSSEVNIGATGSLLVGAAAGSVGSLTIGGGSAINANSVGIGGNSDTVPGGIGNVTVTGLGSTLRATGEAGFIGVGRGGPGSLTVSNQGTVEAIILNVGRAAGGSGTMTVDNSTITLSGQQTTGNLVGAALAIGNLGGTGTMSITNGSVVNITNLGTDGAHLNLGGTRISPLGTGTLTVSNSQINMTAQPGLAAARIGHDGTGTATLTSSTLNIGNRISEASNVRDGSLLVAGLAGSVGTLTLNSNSVVNTSYVGIGATQAGQGGAGQLILNNSTINTDKFELGANGVLSGNDGTINATGDVIVGGTIGPGNSPGRIKINCNIVTLAGSKLILEIGGDGEGGFDVDHITIGKDSTFDLSQLEIVFTFLGDINPTTFHTAVGLDLDNFLESFDPVSGLTTGLSSVFGARTWADVVNTGAITARSDFYDVTNLKMNDNGSFEFNSAPIPEPATWAMMILGLMLISAMARQRQSVLRRA
jgi:T5SS/PEP-CTERM-associated repeat protein